MGVKLGTYSLKIKTFYSTDLKENTKYKDLKFELYQKVFYIMAIPVLPIDKFWKVKNISTNEEVTTTPELRTELNLIALKKRSPFWAYTGTLILLLPIFIVLGVFGYQYALDLEYEHKKSELRQELNIETQDLLKSTKVNDVFLFNVREMIPKYDTNGKRKGFKRGYKSDLKYRVVNVLNDSITLSLQRPRHFTIDVDLKTKTTISKKDLNAIIDTYKSLDFYSQQTDDKGRIKAEALFNLDKIEINL